MKKLFAVLAVVVLLVSLCVPVLAAEAEFTPSVTYKPGPGIVEVPDDDGNPAVATIHDGQGRIIDYIYEHCLVITPVAEVDTSEKIPEDARKLLKEVYEKLKNGEMELPYDKVDKDLNSGNMVIRDLFDISFLCEDHPKLLAQEGVYMDIKFDLGVAKGEEVVVMVYLDGEWVPVKAVNNGDGTVTCTFDDICPVAFSVKTGVTPPEKTGDISGMKWAVIALIALIAIVAVTVIYRVDLKKHAAE